MCRAVNAATFSPTVNAQPAAAGAAHVFKLGDRVVIDRTLRRTTSRDDQRPVDPDDLMPIAGPRDAEKVWVEDLLPAAIEGIIIGKRSLTNGLRAWESDWEDYGPSTGYWTYTPRERFTAWLVAVDLHRKPVLVRNPQPAESCPQ